MLFLKLKCLPFQCLQCGALLGAEPIYDTALSWSERTFTFNEEKEESVGGLALRECIQKPW